MKKILLPVSDSLKARLDQKRREGYAFTASFSRCWRGALRLGRVVCCQAVGQSCKGGYRSVEKSERAKTV